jgi:hypothetical protein
MSKLEELFKKADGDEALKNALIAAQEEYQAAKAKAREAKQEKIIELAKKAGVTLEAADFKPKTKPLSDESLAKASGGGEWKYADFIHIIPSEGGSMRGMWGCS